MSHSSYMLRYEVEEVVINEDLYYRCYWWYEDSKGSHMNCMDFKTDHDRNCFINRLITKSREKSKQDN